MAQMGKKGGMVLIGRVRPLALLITAYKCLPGDSVGWMGADDVRQLS